MTKPSSLDLSNLSNEEMKELQKQLEHEQEERDVKRFEEVAKQFKEGAASVGMTPEEVVMRMQRGGKKSLIRKAMKSVQYRNPENPLETWLGRGKRPNWLNEKLDNGASLEDFKV